MSADPPVRIALTFDVEHPDRPDCSPDATGAILDVLGAAGARATFFLQGRWVEAYPSTARRIPAEGHLVGSHSFYHASMPLLSDEGLVTDIAEAERAIVEGTGANPKPWFRCPFGDGADDPRVLEAIGRLGYRHVGWDLGVGDWRSGRNADHVVDLIAARAGSTPTCIVLLHGWPAITPVAVRAAIERLAARDTRFVTIDELADAEIPPGLPPEDASMVDTA